MQIDAAQTDTAQTDAATDCNVGNVKHYLPPPKCHTAECCHLVNSVSGNNINSMLTLGLIYGVA